ncbi:MAG TPA: hypothetical protein VMG10_26185 [Gemmataceae bacterium]|nr:hypothetical protein [Gemmataceae bacterium]
MDPLHTSLLDLLRELDGRKVPLVVGGGYGLYLKRDHLARTGQQTLFTELPSVRSTSDIDMFLNAEVLADFPRTKAVADAIKQLGYQAVEHAKFLQWKRAVAVAGTQQEVRIDVLVGPLGRYRERMKVNPPRARPKGNIQLHAHTVEEALHIEDQPIGVAVAGITSDAKPYGGTVYVPEAFPYLLMKLHAFRDRKADADRDLGRHHALDIYAIVGMMTESEYERAKAFGAADKDDEHVRQARMIVSEDFANVSAMGLLRIREHKLFRSAFQLGDFVDVLREVFDCH